jgi:hypothetical protein
VGGGQDAIVRLAPFDPAMAAFLDDQYCTDSAAFIWHRMRLALDLSKEYRLKGITDMLFSLVPAILGSHVLIAAAGLPSIDLQKLCRSSERAIGGLSGDPMRTFDSCMSDEQDAREQLLRDWVTYPSSDRALCMRATDYLPSYVEWITCAEMAKDLRRIRKEKPLPPG